MKNLKKYFAICLALVMLLSCIPAVSAAEVGDATINEEAKASLTIWKFDWTNAYKDGVWDEDSFISTSWRESYVEEVLGETVREGDANGEIDNPLGNGQNSNGYALKGVEFTILKVADIVTFSESASDDHPDYNLTQVLYGFHKERAADLLATIGLMLFSYQQACFDVDSGNRRMQLGLGLLTAFCCFVALSGTQNAVLYFTGGIWCVCNLSNPQKREISHETA